MSDILDWARNEVAIACKKENPNRKEGEFDYGCACYESALKAFESLAGDGHSGFSIKMTQAILNRLIDGKPLTHIEDKDDIWNTGYEIQDKKIYQCKRMSSLFKHIQEDGTIEYTDNNYCYCINIHDSNDTYFSNFVSQLIYEKFPIIMPYMPANKPIKVYCEEFLTDKKNGDFDTLGVFYLIKEENGQPNRIEINRFFKEMFETKDGKPWIEITKEEYDERKSKKI